MPFLIQNRKATKPRGDFSFRSLLRARGYRNTSPTTAFPRASGHVSICAVFTGLPVPEKIDGRLASSGDFRNVEVLRKVPLVQRLPAGRHFCIVRFGQQGGPIDLANEHHGVRLGKEPSIGLPAFKSGRPLTHRILARFCEICYFFVWSAKNTIGILPRILLSSSTISIDDVFVSR